MKYTQSEGYKEMMKARRAKERERKALLTPEQREREKQEAIDRKAWAKHEREERRQASGARKLKTRERKILTFMKKTGVEYHHHDRVEMVDINFFIERLKHEDSHTSYDPYYWNHSGGTSQMPIALLGRLWSSCAEFETMYDVPLDGTYRFQCYDSGQRGLGSFGRITAIKVEEPAYVPHVEPGAMVPITAN